MLLIGRSSMASFSPSKKVKFYLWRYQQASQAQTPQRRVTVQTPGFLLGTTEILCFKSSGDHLSAVSKAPVSFSSQPFMLFGLVCSCADAAQRSSHRTGRGSVRHSSPRGGFTDLGISSTCVSWRGSWRQAETGQVSKPSDAFFLGLLS